LIAIPRELMALISVKLRMLSATVATTILLVALPVRPAAADYISSELGAAGSWTEESQ
jgi:hypothetical protein